MASAPQEQSYSGHVLPPYFEAIQRYVVLPLLLIAEFYVNGLLAARGFVANLNDPASWPWYGWVGVAVMFVACGLAGAGVALGLSGRCAEAFANGRAFMGIFTLLGCLLFAGFEMYAGISERSVNLVNTPADTAIGAMLGLQLQAITPATLIAAAMLTLQTIFYGFALKPPKIEAAEIRRERMQREQEEAEHKLRLAAIKGRSLGARFGGMAAAAKEQIAGEKPADEDAANQDGFSPETDDGTGGKVVPISGRKHGARGQGRSGAAGVSLPRNHWLKADLVSYVRETYGAELSPDKAGLIVSNAPGHIQHKRGFAGSPYSAPKAQLIAWAKTEYGQETEQVQQA